MNTHGKIARHTQDVCKRKESIFFPMLFLWQKTSTIFDATHLGWPGQFFHVGSSPKNIFKNSFRKFSRTCRCRCKRDFYAPNNTVAYQCVQCGEYVHRNHLSKHIRQPYTKCSKIPADVIRCKFCLGEPIDVD